MPIAADRPIRNALISYNDVTAKHWFVADRVRVIGHVRLSVRSSVGKMPLESTDFFLPQMG